MLILEDQADDAALALHQLRLAGFDPTWRRVDDEEGFAANLNPELDLIIADYHLPQFDAIRALKLMQQAGLEIPFVIVSGAIGEDLAVTAVRLGAMDYVLKDRMARLGTAVQNALEQARLRRRQRDAQRELEHQALHDRLTNLPNRLMLQQRLEHQLAQRRRCALLLLDIDNFKEINDTFGHQIGDGLLGQVGPRLRNQLEPGDFIARLGGDEFGILLVDSDADRAANVAHAILGVERPFVVEDHALEVAASIGIAVSPQHGTTAEMLLQRADVALYVAKRAGNSYALYRPEDDPYDASRLVLQGDLRRAISLGEIILYYQPQVALATGAVTGLEALARWRHSQRGWVPPAEFIPVAERMGLIKPLSACLIELAGGQMVEWRASSISVPVAVNISMRNLLDPQFPKTLRDVIGRTGVEAHQMKLEITESALMTEPARVLDTMNQLRALGLGFSIDDFGTGYSSLAYLQRLPVEEIKIDRSFVGALATDSGSAAIVQATIELAGSLGLNAVAEGVEDETTWRTLQRLGCSAAQGYFISHPMPAGEVPGWLWEWSRMSARRLAA
ncbi:MAG TPA: EAL domain-containing protein [Candidatus Limnocylindrales bacterium]|nr:EAL domain-containing protein [Candidatus Limnocylindrales bacterium]